MSTSAPQAPIEPALAEAASFTEATLDALLPKPAGPEARLLEAMRQATLAADRRLLAFLVLQSGRLFSVDRRALGRVAAAVECVQAYALTHHDLPSVGGSELRSNPPLHSTFGEATAVLAGDALITFAFALVSSPEAHGDPFVRCELIGKLAAAAGHGGMVGGEAMEIASAGASPALSELTRRARMKTAALVTFCCEAGAIMGKASGAARQALFGYGQELGLALQIADDLALLERAGNGNGPASNRDRERTSVASALGTERARAQAEALAAQAATSLDMFDEKADLLRAAALFAVLRRSPANRA
jgi:farnesyl diphosphate synthase